MVRFIIHSRQFALDLFDTGQAGLQLGGQRLCQLSICQTPMGCDLSPSAYSATTLFLLLHSSKPMVGLSCSFLTWRSTAVR